MQDSNTVPRVLLTLGIDMLKGFFPRQTSTRNRSIATQQWSLHDLTWTRSFTGGELSCMYRCQLNVHTPRVVTSLPLT
jgi:hypothetical protein